MKPRNWFVMMAVLGIVAAGTAFALEEKAEEKEKESIKLKCPVSGRDINKEMTVDYKEAKVYFCCDKCPKAFAKQTAKFAAKANHQLVASEQYQQKGVCPLTGRPLNKEQFTKVAEVKVVFCCPNCKGKVQKQKPDEQLTTVFNEKNFKKAFEKKKKKEEKKEDKAA